MGGCVDDGSYRSTIRPSHKTTPRNKPSLHVTGVPLAISAFHVLSDLASHSSEHLPVVRFALLSSSFPFVFSFPLFFNGLTCFVVFSYPVR